MVANNQILDICIFSNSSGDLLIPLHLNCIRGGYIFESDSNNFVRILQEENR